MFSLKHFKKVYLPYDIDFQSLDKDNRIKLNDLIKTNISGLKFRSIGPALTSGRIADIAVNPNKHKNTNHKWAHIYISWITSEKGKKLINNFKKYGEQLFFFNYE